MNKRKLFLSAHAITRDHMAKNPKDKYREVFAQSLRFLYATFKNKAKLDASVSTTSDSTTSDSTTSVSSDSSVSTTSDAFAPAAENTDSTVENDQPITNDQPYIGDQSYIGDYSYMGYQPVRSENPFVKEQQSAKTQCNENINANVNADTNQSHQQSGPMVLPYKTVMVNEYSRAVALKIVGSQILAKIVNSYNGGTSAVMAMVLCQYFGHKKSNFFMLHF